MTLSNQKAKHSCRRGGSGAWELRPTLVISVCTDEEWVRFEAPGLSTQLKKQVTDMTLRIADHGSVMRQGSPVLQVSAKELHAMQTSGELFPELICDRAAGALLFTQTFDS